ncbi:MAG: hypothetical protein ACRERE_02705 [Candidatus Entotheonellia bacterium]
MGILGDIGKVIIGGVLAGPAGAISVFTVEHGTEVIEGTIDVARQIVTIGTDVYRAIPPEAFALAGDPLHGLLKHEAEDELILLGQIGANAAIFSGLFWPALGPIGASLAIAQGAVPLYVTVGSLVGKLVHRLLHDDEWEMARYIFRDSLYDRAEIILTNLGGVNGRPFVYPIGPLGPVFVNLGNRYVHNLTTPDGPVLFHELTHVWQAKQRVLTEIFLYDALERAYDFTHGGQWSEYSLEQQPSIVEAWTQGAIDRIADVFSRVRNKFAIGSPVFRYINGNVRRSDDEAETGSGRSVRQLLTDGGHRTMKDMHSEPPLVWWP